MLKVIENNKDGKDMPTILFDELSKLEYINLPLDRGIIAEIDYDAASLYYKQQII